MTELKDALRREHQVLAVMEEHLSDPPPIEIFVEALLGCALGHERRFVCVILEPVEIDQLAGDVALAVGVGAVVTNMAAGAKDILHQIAEQIGNGEEDS